MSQTLTTSHTTTTRSDDHEGDSLRSSLRSALESGTLPYLGLATPVGLLGAFAVAAFVFAIDVANGTPLATPNVLGAKLLLGENLTYASPIRLGVVFGYSLVHVAAFIIAAAAFASTQAAIASRSVPVPLQAAAGALLTFLGLQALFGVMLAMVGGFQSVEFGWMRIAGGNALAALVMTALLMWRRYELESTEPPAA